jgi:hypothetical protein
VLEPTPVTSVQFTVLLWLGVFNARLEWLFHPRVAASVEGVSPTERVSQNWCSKRLHTEGSCSTAEEVVSVDHCFFFLSHPCLPFAGFLCRYVVRRSKHPTVLPLLYLSLGLHALHPTLQSAAKQLLRLDDTQALVADLVVSALAALSSRALFARCAPSGH